MSAVQALPSAHHDAYLAGFAKAMRISAMIQARHAASESMRAWWSGSARRHSRDLVRFLRQARAS